MLFTSVSRDADLRRPIALIDRPTLVVGGDHDTVTLPAVHLPNVELPREYEDLVLRFLNL